MSWHEPFILASASPRRRALLEQAGYRVTCIRPSVDDGRLVPRDSPSRWWVIAMAWLKARSVMVNHDVGDTILAADTVCYQHGRIIGKPADRAAASAMLRGFQNAQHEVLTGVCLLCPKTRRRELFVESARVTLGELRDDDLERYLDGDQWRGKAGGYNLHERLTEGWPLTWIGDDATITGLPLRRLSARVSNLKRKDPPCP